MFFHQNFARKSFFLHSKFPKFRFRFTETCNECRDCGRWLDKGGQWIHADFESRELLNICLKKVGGLNQRGVKLADALWIYTEPHSKRLKIKLTIHREVLDRAVIAHDLVIEYILQDKQCRECQRQWTPHKWVAQVQIRQKSDHKRTLFHLEQIILAHGKHMKLKMTTMKQHDNGMDLHFMTQAQASSFADFVLSKVPAKKSHLSKQLISHNVNSTTYNYKLKKNLANKIFGCLARCEGHFVLQP